MQTNFNEVIFLLENLAVVPLFDFVVVGPSKNKLMVYIRVVDMYFTIKINLNWSDSHEQSIISGNVNVLTENV